MFKTEFGDYDQMYGTLDYGDAVVLDIGADYGTTALYFLEKGAAKVYVSERNPEWDQRLKEWAEAEPRVERIPPISVENAPDLLSEIRPDVVKVDCEKCERFLLSVLDAIMGAPRSWVMETHTRELYEAFMALFAGLGYEVTTVEEFPENPPERCVKVITAERL